MTEKLLTGTLSLNTTNQHSPPPPHTYFFCIFDCIFLTVFVPVFPYSLCSSFSITHRRAFFGLIIRSFNSATHQNQRTSGPVNPHLTPGPGIYFNAFIHVYSPRAGAKNPLGTNVDVNRKPLSLCPFVASFKTISLKSDFIHVFSCFCTCI